MPGVTATEIRIGSTTSLSGPVSALGVQARCQEAYFKMLNEQGGIAGRQIKYIYYDDAFNPAKTVEQVRRLIESDNVAFLFNMLGTAPNSSVVKYINAARVPHLFLSVNGDKWGDYKTYPWTMGFAPSARTEAQVFVKYALSQHKDAKFAVLYQNDDLGRDYIAGLKSGLGDKAASMIVAEVSYELTDPTVDSQIVKLKAASVDLLYDASTPKFAAQAIRKVADLDWHPVHILDINASPVSATLKPAGLDISKGIISTNYGKDPADPQWKDDPGVKAYFAFMDKYYPEGDKLNTVNTYGYSTAELLIQVLKQCGDDLTRENLMKQAASLNFEIGIYLPGTRIKTGPDDYAPIEQLQMMRFKGESWERFGPIMSGEKSS